MARCKNETPPEIIIRSAVSFNLVNRNSLLSRLVGLYLECSTSSLARLERPSGTVAATTTTNDDDACVLTDNMRRHPCRGFRDIFFFASSLVYILWQLSILVIRTWMYHDV